MHVNFRSAISGLNITGVNIVPIRLFNLRSEFVIVSGLSMHIALFSAFINQARIVNKICFITLL